MPWIQAFVWAFKPTEIIDVRRFPRQENQAIDEDIAKLSHKPPPKKTDIPPSDEETKIEKGGDKL